MTPQERAKQQAEVMLAYANGAEIEAEFQPDYWRTDCWRIKTNPVWNWELWNYRVKKPAPKAVKLEAWIDLCGSLCHYIKGRNIPSGWKRIPSLDLEYTEELS